MILEVIQNRQPIRPIPRNSSRFGLPSFGSPAHGVELNGSDFDDWSGIDPAKKQLEFSPFQKR
jgi:hypothetical protein